MLGFSPLPFSAVNTGESLGCTSFDLVYFPAAGLGAEKANAAKASSEVCGLARNENLWVSAWNLFSSPSRGAADLPMVAEFLVRNSLVGDEKAVLRSSAASDGGGCESSYSWSMSSPIKTDEAASVLLPRAKEGWIPCPSWVEDMMSSDRGRSASYEQEVTSSDGGHRNG